MKLIDCLDFGIDLDLFDMSQFEGWDYGTVDFDDITPEVVGTVVGALQESEEIVVYSLGFHIVGKMTFLMGGSQM